MSARPQLALVLSLALVLVIGLAGIFLWSGFGTGEGLPDSDLGTTTQAGDTGADPGSLQADTEVEGDLAGDAHRENIQPPPGAAAPRLELTGRLVRSDGAPGAGLTLRCRPLRGAVMLRGSSTPQVADSPVIKIDADGRFRTAVKAESMTYLSLDGTEAVFKDGTGRGMVVQMGQQSKDLGDVLVLTPARVSGQVVDSTGGPVAGVSVTHTDGTGSLWALVLGRGNKTDKEGRFDLVGLRPGQRKLQTRSPDHLPAEQAVELAEGQHRKDIIIQVQPGGFILGTVVNDLGQPVPDAEVAASRTQQVDTQIKITAFSPGESTRTDQAGRFRLANLNTKKATLRVAKTGLDTQTVPDVVVGTTDLVMELKRLGAIEGVLVDEKNRPVQGSTVAASPGGGRFRVGDMLPGGISRSATVTNAAGEFRLENVRPGQVLVTARSDSHLPARERIQVRPGDTTRGVRLTATPGTILEVTVQDPAGRPVANATVTVKEKTSDGPMMIPAGGHGRKQGRRRFEYRAIRRGRNGPPVFFGAGNNLGTGKTDARGKVTIGGLPSGDVVIGAKHEELALVEPQDLVLPGRGKARAQLSMRRGGFLLVSAVDSAGKPVANARFEVTGPTAGNAGDGNDAESQEESCDGDGKAKVGPLSAGEYSAALLGEQRPRTQGGMSFTLAGMEPSLGDSKITLQVREGSTTEIVLRKPVLTTVRGSVRDRSGPVKGAQVALIGEGEFRLPLGNGLEARTDAEGHFEITGVPSGKYTLSWGRRSAIVPSEDKIHLQKDQAELVRHLVIPGAVVKLLAWDAEDAEPVEDAEVTLSRISAAPAAGQGQPRRQRTQIRMVSITNQGSGPQRLDMSAGDRSASTDEDGQVVIKDVPPGKYDLSIKHRRFATHREQIEVLGDATLDLGSKKLTSGGSVSGRIVFEAADQMQMAVVQLTTWDGKDSNRTVSTNGRFRFSGLASGKYKVRAQRVGGNANAPWGPEETVEVKPGRTARTKLKLPPN